VPEPRVSVVIPACDAERFVGEAIESCLAQTYPQVETIVVDDGSGDRTAAVASEFEGITLIRQENRGVAAARNAGVAAGTGELVAFLDADDAMLPRRLEVQVGHLLANPEIGYVLAMQETFVEDGAPLPFWARGEAPTIYPMSMVMSRRLFEEMGGFAEELLGGNDDADLLMRLSEADVPFARLPDVLVRRRIHATNLTQDEAQAKTAVFELFKRRIDRHRAGGP
jgi:glycosyltransferase involved in cell wall biosynthesis